MKNGILYSFLWKITTPFYVIIISPLLIKRIYQSMLGLDWTNLDENSRNKWLFNWWDKIEKRE